MEKNNDEKISKIIARKHRDLFLAERRKKYCILIKYRCICNTENVWNYIYIVCIFNGTVARDFLPLAVFIKK
jgi:hypothetical protein